MLHLFSQQGRVKAYIYLPLVGELLLLICLQAGSMEHGTPQSLDKDTCPACSLSALTAGRNMGWAPPGAEIVVSNPTHLLIMNKKTPPRGAE